MSIMELFCALELSDDVVSQIMESIQDYNLRNHDAKLRELDPNDDIGLLTMSHMPFIGQALAQVRNRQFLDEAKTKPLDRMVYAAIYASLELERFFIQA